MAYLFVEMADLFVEVTSFPIFFTNSQPESLKDFYL